MVLFNQLNPKYILNGWNKLENLEVHMAEAALAEEQKVDALVLMNSNMEELDALPLGLGSLAVELVEELLNQTPILEPNVGVAFNSRNTSNPAMERESSMLPESSIKLTLSQIKLKFIEEFKIKSVGYVKVKQMATFIALISIAVALWFERKSFNS